jgi:tripartite-type tricarboxylate transporter receptor subunit TctC
MSNRQEENIQMNSNHRTTLKATAAAAVVMVALSAGSTNVAAQDVASFYSGKTVTMYVGLSAGGGYDTYARTIGRHMVRHIPGNPRLVTKNLTGAGGMRQVNGMYNVFPQDGTVIGIISRNLVTEPAFGNKAAKFDGSKLYWLGSANTEYSLCVFWHQSKFSTTEDLLNKQPIMGGIAVSATTDIHARLVNNVLGGSLKLITGYPGGADINLSMQRGEVDGRCSWSYSSIKSTAPDWLRDNKIHMVLQVGVSKHPELPQIPLMSDLVKDPRDKAALQAQIAPQAFGRPFAAGPRVPKARAAALRKAFWDTLHDPRFLEEAKRRRLEITPMSGEDVQKLVDEIYALPKDVLARSRVAATSSARTSVAKAVVPVETYMGKITALKSGGRRVTWKGDVAKGKLRVSGRRTKITVAGKKAKRKALKVGMNCAFKVKGAQTALNIDCK